MLEFIKNAYQKFVLIIFWIILIGCTIVGGIVGGFFGGGYAVIGVIIGFIIGFVVDILVCGFIATIINIDENLEILARNSSKTGTSSSGNPPGANQSETSSVTNNPPPINRNYGDTWVCKNCGQKNPSTSSSCKGCGEYK